MRLKSTVLATMLALSTMACHSEQPTATDPNVAKNLHVVAEGKNKDLVFKATAPGTLIVNNFTQGGNLYTGHVNAGDQFTLPSNSDHALIGKQVVHLDYNTNIADTYRLYYLAD